MYNLNKKQLGEITLREYLNYLQSLYEQGDKEESFTVQTVIELRQLQYDYIELQEEAKKYLLSGIAFLIMAVFLAIILLLNLYI